MSGKMQYVWKDRKRTFFGLPLAFTKYRLTEEKLFITTGLLNTKEEEIRLYRVMDMTLNRSFGEKIFALGTIHLCSADKSTPEIDLKHIKKSHIVRDLISDCIEKQRTIKGIASREFLDSDGNGVHDGD